jgi:FdhD protein
MHKHSLNQRSPASVSHCEVVCYSGDKCSVEPRDPVAVEEPLEIRVQGKALVVTMRTPGHDHELAAGYLWSEGLIQDPNEILEIAHCERGSSLDENILNVFLRQGAALEDENFNRFSYAASGCGLCGKSTIESIQTKFPAVQSEAKVSVSVLNGLLKTIQKHQGLFELTGGIHAAALFTSEGELVEILEDVGRHNAVDKVLGSMIRKGQSKLDDHLLFVTSRASFEIVQKALSAQIPVIACASAPSSLAVEFAKANNQTLIGFMRSGRFNVYNRNDRLVVG